MCVALQALSLSRSRLTQAWAVLRMALDTESAASFPHGHFRLSCGGRSNPNPFGELPRDKREDFRPLEKELSTRNPNVGEKGISGLFFPFLAVRLPGLPRQLCYPS